MKLPSIIKIPSYQRFNYEPRYYDPIKEDIEERRERIRRIIKADKKSGKYVAGQRLAGAFTRHEHHDTDAPFLRLIVGTFLFSGVVGFLFFGNIAIYITLAVVIAYLFVKKIFFR